uniref:Capsid protein n=1 Tax=Norovirus Hu/GII.6/GZ2010-L1/Guangzhou/CHN/2010 TaxID=1282428 RepID=L7VJB3_NORV|nr:capsid protein [Norovirus Hu/GII.6/GZ2010-L1/Guangzhou/CHN/2010]
MKMASNDAAPSNDGAANLVPEANNEVMALEPVVGASIAAPVVGQQNIIDPWIRENFVQAPQGEFTVSPRNSPGEMLLNLELGPELNPYLSHLSRMYNGYAGGMQVQVVLAGNAFTAGKIIFAAVPPHFPVENISAAQITMCPHVIVDVRQLEPVLLPLPDIRNRFFHYNQEDTPRMRLVAMLYTPLRANSGEDVFTVSCRVLTRPAPDFEFTFLVPPTVESKTKPFTLPILTLGELSNSRFPAPIDMLYTDPNETIVVQPQIGRCTLDGSLQGTTQLVPTQICSFGGTLISQTSRSADSTDSAPRVRNHPLHVQLKNLDGTPYDPTDEVPAVLGAIDFKGTVFGVASQRNTTGGSVGATRAHEVHIDTTNPRYTPKLGSALMYSESDDFDDGQPTRFTPIGMGADDWHQWELPEYSGHLTLNMNLAPAVAPAFPGERILFFRSVVPSAGGYGSGQIDCLIPQEWVQHFYQEAAPSQSAVALIRYVNPDTGRNILEAKLHREGFITVANSGNNPIVVPPNGYFRFEAWVNQFYTLTPMGTGQGRRRVQ